MNPLYQQIGAAWSALSPAPASLSAGLPQVQAYKVTLTNQPISWQAVKLVARRSSTGDWGRVEARSEQTPNLPPSTATDAAILAAKNAVSMADTDMVDPTNATDWTAFQNGLTTLQTSGDISSATVTAINALTSVDTYPLAGVTVRDIWLALGQPAGLT